MCRGCLGVCLDSHSRRQIKLSTHTHTHSHSLTHTHTLPPRYCSCSADGQLITTVECIIWPCFLLAPPTPPPFSHTLSHTHIHTCLRMLGTDSVCFLSHAIKQASQAFFQHTEHHLLLTSLTNTKEKKRKTSHINTYKSHPRSKKTTKTEGQKSHQVKQIKVRPRAPP